MEEYIKVPNSHIGHSRESNELYALEEKISEMIRAAAREWQRYMEKKRGKPIDYWEKAIPSTIATICDCYGFVAFKKINKTEDQTPDEILEFLNRKECK